MVNQQSYQSETRLSATDARLAILQLAVMINSGVSLTRALESLTQAPQEAIAAFGEAVFSKVSQGYLLSRAVRAASETFSKSQVSLIAAGERTGRLALVLTKLSERLEKEDNLRRQLLSALMYPLAILVLTGLMGLFMSNFMLPHLLSAVGSTLRDPPWPTKVLATIAAQGGLVTSVFVVVVCCLPWFASSVPQAQAARNWLLYESPVLGRIGRNTEIANLSGQLSLLLNAGLSLDRALMSLSPRAPQLRLAFRQVMSSVTNGCTLAESFRDTGQFSSDFVALVEVGEETGRLSRALEHQSLLLHEATERELQDLVRLIEPLTMLFLGGMVGFVVLGCFLPIYQVAALSL